MDFAGSISQEIRNPTTCTYICTDHNMRYTNLHIHQNKFANYIGLNPSNLSKLIIGERPINYELALIFGNIFNIDPMMWIEIQAKNEIKKLQKTKSQKYQNYTLSDLISG